MNRNGPIIVIEDDEDDRHMIDTVYKRLSYDNKLVFLTDGMEAYDYLMAMQEVPFIILSDINMPLLDGLQLRRKIFENKNLNYLCIPYIILSTTDEKTSVDKAYSSGIQGYFRKPIGYDELEDTLSAIIKYWKKGAAPGNYIRPDAFPVSI